MTTTMFFTLHNGIMHYWKQTGMNVFFCVLKRKLRARYVIIKWESVKFILIRESVFPWGCKYNRVG